MPHVTIEHSASVADTHDLQALCSAIFEALAAHSAVPRPETLKVRTLPCPHWRVGSEPHSFAHAHLWLLPGRDADTKSELTALILETMSAALADVGSLSVDVADLSDAYTKRVL